MVNADFKFGWEEYTVVAVMLILSLLIGVYYTFFNKQNTFSEYMLGNKTMGVVPVSISIVASHISGVTLLGLPAEVYIFGTQYSACNFSNVTIMVITAIFFLPVYHKLQLNSLFEYLELRFNDKVRALGSFMFSVSLVLYLPAVIYVPALAFHQVTDISVHIIAPVICAACLFYTTFGGLKAVIWTDAIQNFFTFFALVFVIVLGCIRMGGVKEVWRISQEGGRLELFNLDPDPFARNTFWSVWVGAMFILLTSVSVNPGSVQRFLAVSSIKKAKLVLLCSSIGFYVIVNLCVFFGLVLYARYHTCDPLAAQKIKSSTQLVPLYVMEIGRDYPGLAGLFMTGVLSAALSTLSASLNTVGGTLYKDVMGVFFPNVHHSEHKQSTIIKVIVVVIGVICIALVPLIEKLGPILQASLSILGSINGSLSCLFLLGIFVPRANAKGAITGAVVSTLITLWVVFNAQYYIVKKKLTFPGKKTSIELCPSEWNLNSSLITVSHHVDAGTPVVADSSVALIYQLSYNYYIVLGAVTGVVVGLIVSLLTKPPDLTSIDHDLFSACVHRFLPFKKPSHRPDHNQYTLGTGKENSFDKELEEIRKK